VNALLFISMLLSLVIASLTAIVTKVLQDIYWHELEEYVRHRDRDRFDAIHDNADKVAISTESLFYLAIATHVFSGIAWASNLEFVGFDSRTDFAIGIAVGSTIFLFVLAWFPSAIAGYAGTAFLYHTWPVWQTVNVLLSPLSWCARSIDEIVRRLLDVTDDDDEEEALEDEIRTIVVEGQYDGLLDVDTRDMIEGVIELDDANVADIMTHRDKMDVMSVQLGWPEVLDYVTDVGRTRIPVYNGSQDEFLGVLYVKDLFAELRKPPEDRRKLRDVLRTKWNVPTTMRLDELLQQFRQTRNHLALVSDEYNSIVGLVTIEDVLEEIVGEIVDESDKEDLGEIRVLTDGAAEVIGRAHVQDINELLGCDLPEDDEFDTIGGFLMHQLGRIPKQGESVYWNDLQISVLEASGRRAELVRIATV